MTANTNRGHLVCYDIADPRRLSRVHRALVKRGVPIQYSVFLVFASAVDLAELLETLRALIDESEDDLRVYPLPPKPRVTRLGRGTFPEGVTLLGLDWGETGTEPWP